MTAINVLVFEDSVSLITDTKATNSLGHDFNVSKVSTIPHMRLAVATRGKITALDHVTRLISQHAFDYDSARAYLGSYYERAGLGDVEVFVAGWSDSGPKAFFISKMNTGGQITDIPFALVTPTVSEKALTAFQADPIAGMPELLRQQHLGHSVVGGFVSVTTVRAETIETYVTGMIDELAWRAPLAA